MRTVFRLQIVTLALVVFVCTEVVAQERERPRLVVMMVVDQLREDLLDYYSTAFTGGLRRLMDNGYRFTQASHAHARTATAPGHATLATGVFPSRHGIVANSWYERDGFDWTVSYAVKDRRSPLIGYEDEPALEGRSPLLMLREGFADWVQANDDRARVASISKKDRAAIPMGGKTNEHVYWMVPELATFVTSTYYRDRYPGWVDRFNSRVMPGIAEPDRWDSVVPEQHKGLARPDEASYEYDAVHTTFPHIGSDENPDNPQIRNVWAFEQPRADDAVIQLARTAIDELDLGQRNEQDFIAISLSAVDRVGHDYGPYSQEQLSTLIHLDGVLGGFFNYLDETVGEGQWLIGFSADHGVLTIPEAQVSMGTNPNARRIMEVETNQRLAEALREGGGGGGSPDDLANRVARLIEERGHVAKAYTHHELTRGMPADSFAVMFRNSHYPGRAWGTLSRWGVELRYGDGDLVGYPTGTNHESTYWYDRHVPMIFMGAGVVPGTSDAPVYSVDFAPTLAGLAGIPFPTDLDGRRIF